MKTTCNFVSSLAIINAVLAAALFTGCAFSPRPSIDTISDLAGEETILVGRIEITPPLDPALQKLSGQNEKYRGKVIMMVHKDNVDLRQESNWSWYFKDNIEAPMNETFYVSVPKKPFYYLQGIIMMDYGFLYQGVERDDWKSIHLPGRLKIDIRPDDKAVYIGTIRYRRDEFLSIAGTQITDDYERENAIFIRKFGKDVKLRRAIAAPTKN